MQGVWKNKRTFLKQNYVLKEMSNSNRCCGFGGGLLYKLRNGFAKAAGAQKLQWLEIKSSNCIEVLNVVLVECKSEWLMECKCWCCIQKSYWTNSWSIGRLIWNFGKIYIHILIPIAFNLGSIAVHWLWNCAALALLSAIFVAKWFIQYDKISINQDILTHIFGGLKLV